MAPELRKRKPAVEAPKATTPVKSVAKAAVKGKRKAADEASPVSLKKQKPAKKAAAATEAAEEPAEEPAPAAKPAKKTPVKKAAAKKTAVETETVEEPAKTPKAKATKGKKAAKEAEVVEEENDFLGASDESDSEDDEADNAHALAAQLDPEDDESTDKSLFQPGQDVGKAPKPSKAAEKAAKAAAKAAANAEPGVVYVGRIPHGFYEYEMNNYFKQFGKVLRLRASRNKKTGASKHFAFIEFAEASTAEIVAKTMDNYLLFGHILKCKVVPKSDVHDNLFKGANSRFKKIPWNKMAGKSLEKPRTESAWEAKVAREKLNRAKKAEKLKDIGYEFEALDLKDVPAPAVIEAAEEVKAIEAAPEAEEAAEVEEAEVDVEVKTTSAPKTKAKAARGKKAKA